MEEGQKIGGMDGWYAGVFCEMGISMVGEVKTEKKGKGKGKKRRGRYASAAVLGEVKRGKTGGWEAGWWWCFYSLVSGDKKERKWRSWPRGGMVEIVEGTNE